VGDGEGPEPDGAEEQRSQSKSRVFSKYPLPSDRHPFTVHFEILRRFVTYGRTQPVSAERVEGEGVPIQAASMNVRFMASVGLLKFESKGLYSPTPDTIRFVNARSVSDDRARPIMKGIIGGSWFAQSASDLLRSHPIVTEDQLVGELALASETDKSKKGPALAILVDYLVYSGIVVRGDKGLALGDSLSGQVPWEPGTGSAPDIDSRDVARVDVAGLSPRSGAATDAAGWLVVQTEDFYLKVRSDLSALEYVEDQLSLLRKKLSRRSQGTEGLATPSAGPST